MAEARKVAEKDTGNYDVRLVERDDEYYLAVRYTGDWASGEWVEIQPGVDEWVGENAEGDSEKALDAAAREWFRLFVRGDLDVGGFLVMNGYDSYTNWRGRRR